MASEEPYAFPYRIYCAATGEFVWHECAGRPHRNEEGVVTMWYHSVQCVLFVSFFPSFFLLSAELMRMFQ